MYLNLNISNVGRGRKFEPILLPVLYVERERERTLSRREESENGDRDRVCSNCRGPPGEKE
jgi:hypothetical protein